MPSAAVHCQAWKTLARFRLGDWDAFLGDFDRLQQLLGERRNDPPYFAARPFGAAAIVYDAQGNSTAADRLLEILDRLRVSEPEVRETFLSLTSVVYARRGDAEQAWTYLLRGESRGVAPPLLLEASCDVVAELDAWDRTDEVLRMVRAAAQGSGLLALPAFADRLEGRAASAAGDYDRAAGLLTKARDVFAKLEARWEVACTDLSLAEARIGAGNRDSAAQTLSQALRMFEDLRSNRETTRARELLEGLNR
jgi:tetratricopeptide (TPR) repeat protein